MSLRSVRVRTLYAPRRMSTDTEFLKGSRNAFERVSTGWWTLRGLGRKEGRKPGRVTSLDTTVLPRRMTEAERGVKGNVLKRLGKNHRRRTSWV